MERRSRIGLDLDGKNRFRLLKAYFNALKLGKVNVYETEHGYHLKIEKALSPEENIQVRMILGDDPERLAYDELKLRLGLTEFIDTLFTAKRHGDGKISREFPINPLSEALFTKYTPRRPRRA
jgi:hypothetical protein